MGNSESRERHHVFQAGIAALLAAVSAVVLVLSWPTPVLALATTAIAGALIVIWLPRSSILAVIGASVAAGIGAHLPLLSANALAHGLVVGLVVALCLAGPLGVARLIRQVRAYHRRGWALADAEARKHAAEVSKAVQGERMAIAAEMHDGLGHALTLIAVQLGRLSLSADLPDAVRTEISGVRATAAQAARELGTAVRLLQDPHPLTPVGDLTMTIANARNAGMVIEDRTASRLEQGLSPEAASAVLRVVQEGLTNAAKHAPGSPVTVDADLTETEVRVAVRNALPRATASAGVHSNGIGLVGLRQRAAVLGGSLTAARSDDEFALAIVLPRHAKPSGALRADSIREVADEENVAVVERARAARTAAAVPAALLAAIAFVAAAYFVLSNLFSVLPQDQFDKVAAGAPRAEVESMLPPLEMLDAPRDGDPVASGEGCRFYETAVSFFARVDVVYICFDESAVTRTGMVESSD